MNLNQAVGAGSLDIEVTAGPATGLCLTLHEDFRVGSAEQGPAALGGDRWLSPSHALFHHGPDGWAVEDLRSVEGTKVNGRAVTGAVTLHPGDMVEMGSSRIAVQGGAGGPPPPPPGTGLGVSSENRRNLDFKRVIATLLDSVIVATPIVLIANVYGRGRIPFLIVGLALVLTYYFVCESLVGRTIGKRIMGLRVVRMDGLPLTPSAVAARTVLRLVDQQIGCLVGLLTMILTGGRRQRLGDLAAKTAVTRSSTPAPRPQRRGRERLAFYAYPLVWLAPALLLFLLVPETRLLPCQEANLDVNGTEGACLVDNDHVWDIVNTGHTLHVPSYDARLVGTAMKDASARRLRLRSVPGDTAVKVVAFRLAVRNTGARPLRFELDHPSVGLGVALADGRTDIIGHLPRNRGMRLAGFAHRGPIQPGRTRVAWVQFALPPLAVPELRTPGFGVMVYPPAGVGGIVHVGEIRLSRAATPAGARALAGLAG